MEESRLLWCLIGLLTGFTFMLWRALAKVIDDVDRLDNEVGGIGADCEALQEVVHDFEGRDR